MEYLFLGRNLKLFALHWIRLIHEIPWQLNTEELLTNVLDSLYIDWLVIRPKEGFYQKLVRLTNDLVDFVWLMRVIELWRRFLLLYLSWRSLFWLYKGHLEVLCLLGDLIWTRHPSNRQDPTRDRWSTLSSLHIKLIASTCILTLLRLLIVSNRRLRSPVLDKYRLKELRWRLSALAGLLPLHLVVLLVNGVLLIQWVPQKRHGVIDVRDTILLYLSAFDTNLLF